MQTTWISVLCYLLLFTCFFPQVILNKWRRKEANFREESQKPFVLLILQRFFLFFYYISPLFLFYFFSLSLSLSLSLSFLCNGSLAVVCSRCRCLSVSRRNIFRIIYLITALNPFSQVKIMSQPSPHLAAPLITGVCLQVREEGVCLRKCPSLFPSCPRWHGGVESR